MSDSLIASLNSRIQELTTDLATARSEARQRRVAGRDVKAERDALAKQVSDLTADRDGWQQKATAAPGEHAARNAELEAKLLERDHRDTFAALYSDKTLGLNPTVPVEDLIRAINHKPEGTPDPKAIRSAVEAARDARPYLFGQPAGSTGTTVPARLPLDGATGGDRGRAPTSHDGKVTVRKSDLRNPAYMLDPANQRRHADAQAAGTLEVIDG